MVFIKSVVVQTLSRLFRLGGLSAHVWSSSLDHDLDLQSNSLVYFLRYSRSETVSNSLFSLLTSKTTLIYFNGHSETMY